MTEREEYYNQRSIESAKRAQQFPVSVQVGISSCMLNIQNGANWGFVDIATIREYAEELAKDKNFTIRKLSGKDCIIEVVPQYLVKCLTAIDPECFDSAFIKELGSGIISARVELEKFLIAKGKQGKWSGVVGIYCVNDTPTITHKSVTYPAFRVDIEVFLTMLSKYGYSMMINGTYISDVAKKASSLGTQLWDSCQLSPTKTGVFVNIRCDRPAEDYKKLEQQMRSARRGK